MNRVLLFAFLLLLCGCHTKRHSQQNQSNPSHSPSGRIAVSADGRGFVNCKTGQPFYPWGMNYGNAGRLMEDFWDRDWDTFAKDFQKMKAMGANVVRVHLQYGKFMQSPEEPDEKAFKQLTRMLRLAEENELYLDITGLACYRPADVPAWYDALDEASRWEAQARFWEEVAKICAGHPVVFCYDLMNEPIAPGSRREAGKWSSGNLFGGYDFVQFIALDPAGRKREEIPVQWIRRMTAAIRKRDSSTMITVGMLPWSWEWKHLSGFVPVGVAPELDFLSVHLYPETKKPGEALEALRKVAVGKPVVIEETFPLYCGTDELKDFLRESKEVSCGWMGHYDGWTLEELNELKRTNKISKSQLVYRAWLEMFVSLRPEFVPAEK